ncbi:MAG TPA: hypothetical protein VGM11_01640 [Acidobacteriaceae bacterium]
MAGWVRILLWELDRHVKDSRRRAMRVSVVSVMMAVKAHRFLG